MRTAIFVSLIAAAMIVTIQWIAVSPSTASAAGSPEATSRLVLLEPISTAMVVGITVAMLLLKVFRKNGWI